VYRDEYHDAAPEAAANSRHLMDRNSAASPTANERIAVEALAILAAAKGNGSASVVGPVNSVLERAMLLSSSRYTKCIILTQPHSIFAMKVFWRWSTPCRERCRIPKLLGVKTYSSTTIPLVNNITKPSHTLKASSQLEFMIEITD
jgi:hypothetical protein